MANINTPQQTQQLWMGQSVDANWYAFFVAISDYIVQNAQTGTTAQRPTKNLYPGRQYFDQSLGSDGKPVWVNKDSDGWVDAAGNTV